MSGRESQKRTIRSQKRDWCLTMSSSAVVHEEAGPSASTTIMADVLHNGKNVPQAGGGGFRASAAVLCLYLHDAAVVGGRPATLVDAVETIVDPMELSTFRQTVVFAPRREAIVSSASMQRPEYYVALNVAEFPGVTYTFDGPTSALALGDRAQITLTGKGEM